MSSPPNKRRKLYFDPDEFDMPESHSDNDEPMATSPIQHSHTLNPTVREAPESAPCDVEMAPGRSTGAVPRIPPPRYRPYAIHEQLYYRQMLQQEKRRMHSVALNPRVFEPRYWEGRIPVSMCHRSLSPESPKLKVIYEEITTCAMNESEEAELCSICCSNFHIGEMIRKLPCGHRYHIKCIDRWLSRSSYCPICRSNLDVLATQKLNKEHRPPSPGYDSGTEPGEMHMERLKIVCSDDSDSGIENNVPTSV